MKLLKLLAIPLLTLLLASMPSCRKDKILTDPTARLSFSLDTLTFDTVFTDVGSTTLFFKVYNNNRQAVLINSVTLVGGTASPFRINVNGEATTTAREVEILAEDSIYVFVEVTIDPNAATNPFVIGDEILFDLNGGIQSIQLQAYGQNAIYIKDSVLNCSAVWDSILPYVILNFAYVDSLCLLTIQAGTKIYFWGNSSLLVEGTLRVNGTVNSPVTFRHSRLEAFYKTIPGQWFGIVLLRGSVNNIINYAEIINSVYGVTVGSILFSNDPNFVPDPISNLNIPDVVINNTIIKNSAVSGFFGFYGKITAENCLLYNAGVSQLQIQLGGDYDLTHCTLANFSSANTTHNQAILYVSDYIDLGGTIEKIPVNASFTNTIIYGEGAPDNEEIVIDLKEPGTSSYFFENCLLTTKLPTSDVTFFLNNIVNVNPLFTNQVEEDYTISIGSPCENTGKSGAGNLTEDLTGFTRLDPPDMGAYEIQ